MKRILLIAALAGIVLAGCSKKEETVTLASIAVTTQPTKKAYLVNEAFDPAGMVVTATYSNNEKKTVTPTRLDYDFSTVGTKTVTVSYTESGKTVTTTVTGITVTAAGTKSVTVGAQSGTMVAGAGSTFATFPVTTVNIPNGNYTLINSLIGNRPTGVNVGTTLSINNNSGTLTLQSSATTVAGTYTNLTLTLDGVTSNAFTLTIVPAGTKSVTVGATSGTPIIAGVASTFSLYYTVSVTGIANGTYTATVNNLPTGVSVNPTTIVIGSGAYDNLLGLRGNTTTVAGTYTNLRLTLDGVTSPPFTLVILPTKSVTVGAQSGTITAGLAGTIRFPVTTTSIANGTYSATLANNNPGISVQGQVSIMAGSGTLTLAGNTSTVAGDYQNRLTIDGTQSNWFGITIKQPDGTAESPFLVATVADLQRVGTGTNGWTSTAHYRQTANINLSGISNWTPLCNTFDTRFRGVYDGGGYSISNLTINRPSETGFGLFCYMSATSSYPAAIRNVALININITAQGWVGGIAYSNSGGTIENCYTTGNIYSTVHTMYGSLGGIVSANQSDGVVRNCYSTVNFFASGKPSIGGIASSNLANSKIENCYATGSISGSTQLGGIVAENTASALLITNCVALNNSIIASLNTSDIGRVVGSNDEAELRSNYARESGMIMRTGPAGNTVTFTPNLNGRHGANVSAANTHGANSGTWWSTIGYTSTNWDMAANRLPRLKTTTGAAFNQAQNPVVVNN